MRYENRTESRAPKAALIVPDCAGFYWAKWRIPEDGTADEDHFVAIDKWEVVEVHDSFGGEVDLRVSVAGVAKEQSVENFVWHKPIAPLEVPTP